MSKSDAFEASILDLLFKNFAITGIGDAGGLLPSAVAGNLFVTLHTADPGDAGTAITSETAYTGYARQPVARGAGWTRTGNSISPAANVDFPECSAAPGTPNTHFGVASTVSGAGVLLYKGALTPNITMAVGVIPRVKSTTTITED